MLSFEEFQEQVLEVFKCTKEECEFWDSSYSFCYFSALINYTNGHYLFFRVKYVTDPDNCNYGRWIVVKEYDKACIDISDSLVQAVKTVAQQTEESIKEETAIFEKIEK